MTRIEVEIEVSETNKNADELDVDFTCTCGAFCGHTVYFEVVVPMDLKCSVCSKIYELHLYATEKPKYA